MTWLKDKNVSYIINGRDQFFFICTRDYDTHVTIYNSNEKEFKINISRQIEPGYIKIFDVHHSLNSDEQSMSGFGEKMIIFGTQGIDQFYDILCPDA